MIATKQRSLAKTFSYRVSASVVTLAVVFALTDQLSLGITICAVDFLAKTFLYYFHERFWDKVRWGNSNLQ